MEPITPVYEQLPDAIRSLLPEACRSSYIATRHAMGVTLQFTDAQGRRHAVDARTAPLEGSAPTRGGEDLIYSYTFTGSPADVGMILAVCRAALAAMDVPRTDTAGKGGGSEDTEAAFDFESQRPAGEALSSRVRSLLPAEWQQAVRVVVTSDGFAVRLEDAAGARHVLVARWAEAGLPALVQGSRFGFSYLKADDALESTAAVARYHAGLEALRAQEDELADHLRPPRGAAPGTSTADVRNGFDVLNQSVASEVLSSRVGALLPADWRTDVRVVATPEGFAVGFLDAAGVRHVLQAHRIEAGFPALVQGRRLGFSYLKADDGLESAATVARYHEALEGFCAREEELIADLRTARRGASGKPPVDAHHGFDVLDQPAANETLSARVRALLPSDWRTDVQVVALPEGFAVGFRDAAGARHVLQGHWIEAGFPALVQGCRLGFSYLKADDAPESAATVARYREALGALRAQEDQIAADLGTVH